MRRMIMSFLLEWLEEPGHKPLVLRGARQVGKTWVVRRLAEKSGKELVELNFEHRPDRISLFKSNDPNEILVHLRASLGLKIHPKQSILFLDEIQAFPELLAKLRWFAEKLPELPVIAAGSLLEFVLEKHTFSMPVGRIHYLHLEPLSYEEFLLARGKATLFEYIQNFTWQTTIPDAIHHELTSLFKEYSIIGGMPAAVGKWSTSENLSKVSQIHHDLHTTYREDFAKYRGRIEMEHLEEVMLAVPRMLGSKFVYSHVNPDVSHTTIKKALALLTKARICHQVHHTAANGIPLHSETKSARFKVIFIDTGLCSTILGLRLDHITHIDELTLIHQGALAEQITGQLLRTLFPPYVEPKLCCWMREQKGSNAEIDYVIQHHNQIVPIEVKAGSTGSLKSLHLFMHLKSLKLALRFNSSLPTKTPVKVLDHSSNRVQYTLFSLPFYLIGQTHRLVEKNII